MSWLTELFTGHSIAHTILVLSLVIASGVFLGQLRVLGASMGVVGVLFTGLLVGHFHLPMDEKVVEFTREFGLILFVFSVGLQVGPGFFSSLRKQGLKLNLLAVLIVALGILASLAIFYLTRLPIEVVVGILAGAVTNTPSLGAAQQALNEYSTVPEAVSHSGLGYAVAYPFGVFGVILAMVMIRKIFRIRPGEEAEAFEREQAESTPALLSFNIVVKNESLSGERLGVLSSIVSGDFAVSRILRAGRVKIAKPDILLALGDVLHVVTTEEMAKKLALVVGALSDVDVLSVPSNLTARRILVTQKSIAGKAIQELNLASRYGVSITRVHRAGLELVANAKLCLQFGDRLTVVGNESSTEKVAAELGDSIKLLNYPNISAIFVGMILGVLAGSIPFSFPGIPTPVKLGSAGGVLVVAILLARWNKIGPVIWYLPESSSLLLREFGISLFLAAVGLRSGGEFVNTLLHGGGFYWMLLGSFVTLVPILLVMLFARVFLRMNYMVLCGLISGSMTDPPALAYVNQLAGSNAPSVTYASVYPLTMFLRIIAAQVLVLLLVQ